MRTGRGGSPNMPGMSQAARARMEPDDFLQWCLKQEGRWELIGGQPTRLMTGATRAHDLLVVNLIAGLRNRLRGGPCVPMTDDVASRMPNGNVRRPDVTVDCAKGAPGDLTSTEPSVFFEVLSPSTRSFDFIVKAEEYKQVPSLKHFVLLDPEQALVHVWSRGGAAGWTGDRLEGLSAQLDLPGLGVVLPLAELYDGVEVRPGGDEPS